MSPRWGFGWRGNTIFCQYVYPNGAVKVPAGQYNYDLAQKKAPSRQHLIKEESSNLTEKTSPNYFLQIPSGSTTQLLDIENFTN
jgi:hypothetical protein